MNLKSNNDILSLFNEVNSDITDEYLIKILKLNKNLKFIGSIDSSQNIQNILTKYKFYKNSAYYGVMYEKNVSTLLATRKKKGADLIATDKDGILKNSLNSEDAILRIEKAMKDNIPIIYIFGTSTLTSMGARIPDHSIPALIERIFELRYKKKIVCINFGLGGTYSQDALNLLTSKALNMAVPNSVIFYDGWNCCQYLNLTNKINKINERHDSKKKIIFSEGESLRNVEHNDILNSIYDPHWMCLRSFKLIGNHFLSAISKISDFLKFKVLSRIIKKIQNRFFFLSNTNIIKILRENVKLDTEWELKKDIPKIVEKYINIHKYTREVCKIHNINFFWAYQPLIFNGNKELTKEEVQFKENSLSKEHPFLYSCFHKELKKQINDLKNLNKYHFDDMSNIFDEAKYTTYVDHGHLNSKGNLLVASKLTDNIYKKIFSNK